MSTVTTHVLDAARGRPATGVRVRLEQQSAAGWTVVAEGETDADGRVRDLGPGELPAGTHQLVFDTAAYFAALGVPAFYPQVCIAFSVADGAEHYHVPLLLSPFAYSTYRGS